MSRRKQYVDLDLTFKPQINRTSKKLAGLRIPSTKNGKPHFMQNTLASYIANISKERRTLGPVRSFKKPSPRLDMTSGVVSSVGLSLPPESLNLKAPIPQIPASSGMKTGESTAGPQLSNRNTTVAARLIEENKFTFKPKVSAQSAKIAESLGSDFMSRQQQHIEKQKKHVSTQSIKLFELDTETLWFMILNIHLYRLETCYRIL